VNPAVLEGRGDQGREASTGKSCRSQATDMVSGMVTSFFRQLVDLSTFF
jgi:hypothetical protein